MSKKRAYGEGFDEEEQKAAWYTLHKVMKNFIKAFSPNNTIHYRLHLVEIVWKGKYSFPNFRGEDRSRRFFSLYFKSLLEFNSLVWKEKKRRGLTLKDKIDLEVPKELKIFEKELKLMHNITNTTK